MTDYRVLVTGNDENSKSHIVLNTPINVENYFTYQPGFSVEVFWQTSANTTVGEPFKTITWDKSSILPKPAATSSMIITFPPISNTESLASVNLEILLRKPPSVYQVWLRPLNQSHQAFILLILSTMWFY